MAQDPYKYFRVEAAELHGQLGQGFLDLEKPGRTPELVPRLLRLAHTLKGAARIVKQPEIADHAHAIEEALQPFRESAAAVPRERIDVLLRLLDGVGSRVAELTAARPIDVAAPKDREAPDEGFRTMRADVAEMDALLDAVGEACVQVGSVRRSQASLSRARQLGGILVDQLAGPRARDGARTANIIASAKAHSIAEELLAILTDLERGVAAGVDQLDHELEQVRDAAEQLRLMPAGVLFTALERAVRDVAQAQSKLVTFHGRGSDLRMDGHVLGAVQGALVQLVRNAVAHGIETREARLACGKPAAGTVTLDVSRRGRNAVFTCEDDGRGVDLDAVRQAAQRKGLLTSGPRDLGTKELLDLLLQGRISTSGTVTEHSGRGIGLDLLREAAKRLDGVVSIRTEAGKGTAIELVVPLSLASLDALMVEASGRAVAIPLDAVRHTLRLVHSDVARTAQGESIVHAGKVIPIASLARLLDARSKIATTTGSAVIIAGAGGMAAVAVDRLVGTGNVILRPLPELAPAAAVVAGASVDVSGNPQLVLDPDGLVAAARGAGLVAASPEVRRHRILVIDDSMTTRMLEQSILESAGYGVDVAISGEEALEKARRERFALFLVDVEMPGMDGFTFIEHARSDPSLRDVPCILVTSRGSSEDRQRGQDAGARGHIVKGEFDQNELLAQIRKLVD